MSQLTEEQPELLTLSDINDDVLGPTSPPRRLYWLVMGALAVTVAYALSVWIYQVQVGMGVAGINHPVGWGVYIVTFVFWVGIAHSGTLISAILHLVRARWRTAIARSAEAMTVFAVMTAGLFPLIHLGRLWVFYFIMPYPSQRQLWPNFQSPLLWDVVAISTYLTVSSIFWFVGLLPDLAAARDRWAQQAGSDHPRTRLYRLLALGWDNSGNGWRHHGRAYLFFAALATPLVISVHSVVSWDFAMGVLPGWHTTIFPPYFVAGAIHSGLAMVLTLLIPMRRLLGLERIITMKHFDSVAKTLLVTTCIMGYAYGVEPFISWYSGDHHEQQFAFWRAFEGGGMSVAYWALWACNVLIPLAFFWRRVRSSIACLLTVSVAINVGMWLERYVIVCGSTSHDFLPHNWGSYVPTWVELSILAGAAAFFAFWFLGFSKLLPTVSVAEVKEELGEESAGGMGVSPERNTEADPRFEGQPADGSGSGMAKMALRRMGKMPMPQRATGVLAIFDNQADFLSAVGQFPEHGGVETFSPYRVKAAEKLLGRGPSAVRYWTLLGALVGMSGGLALAIGSSAVNNLIVGGKLTPVAIVPYFIVAFEGTVLLGTIFNFAAMMLLSRRGRARLAACQDARFSRDRFGVFVPCDRQEQSRLVSAMVTMSVEEIRVIQ